MSKCVICGKKAMTGMSVSRTGTRGFIKKRSKRRFKPNIRTVKIKAVKGTKKLKVCAKCLKTMKKKQSQNAKLKSKS